MTATTPTTTTAELREQLAAKRSELDDAANDAAASRERHGDLRGLLDLGRSSHAEMAEAGESVRLAEEKEADKVAAVKVLVAELAEAEVAERDQRLADLRQGSKSVNASRSKAIGRLDRTLRNVELALSEIHACDATQEASRAEVEKILDLAGGLAAIEQRTGDKAARLRKEAPVGMEVNYDGLERRMESEMATTRARVRREAEEVAPPPNNDALEQVLAKHTALAPMLLDETLRRAISEGFEFVGQVQSQNAFSRPTFVGRLYSSHEFPEAGRRRDAFLSALRVLASPADRIGAEMLKYPGGTAVQAA